MDRSGRIGIIADDMTGALMVAAYYETAGIRAMVVTEIDAIKDCGGETIIIWAGRTRLIDPVEACRQADHAAAAFDAIGCDRVVSTRSVPVSIRPNRGISDRSPTYCTSATSRIASCFAPVFRSSTRPSTGVISSIAVVWFRIGQALRSRDPDE
ncbi:hypothetical protein HED63_27880 [Ochrobactrum cytisi]|nr:hypothetical protein [Brucella cytisi]